MPFTPILARGVHVAAATVFLMRIPADEKCCEASRMLSYLLMMEPPSCQGHFDVARVQRRLLHILCQEAEETVATRLTSDLPPPDRGDDYHPSKKCLVVLMCP